MAQPRVVDRDENTIFRDSSIFNRQNKNFQITAQLTGVGPSLSVGNGLQFGKFLNPNELIFLEITSAQNSSSFFSTSEVKTQSFGAHYKRFSGNSFYWRAGADFRKFLYKYHYDSISGSAYDIHQEFEGTSIAGNFQIGNQWQWENFTLGCDWVGISVPFQSDVSKDVVVSPYQSDSEQQERDIRRAIKDAHINLLRFYLGFSF